MEADEAEGHEQRAPGTLERTAAPTRAMREEHECAGHGVYCPYCEDYVAGRGRSRVHRAVHRAVHRKAEDELPVVSLDYGFLGPKCGLYSEDDVDILSVFVGMRD